MPFRGLDPIVLPRAVARISTFPDVNPIGLGKLSSFDQLLRARPLVRDGEAMTRKRLTFHKWSDNDETLR